MAPRLIMAIWATLAVALCVLFSREPADSSLTEGTPVYVIVPDAYPGVGLWTVALDDGDVLYVKSICDTDSWWVRREHIRPASREAEIIAREKCKPSGSSYPWLDYKGNEVGS